MPTTRPRGAGCRQGAPWLHRRAGSTGPARGRPPARTLDLARAWRRFGEPELAGEQLEAAAQYLPQACSQLLPNHLSGLRKKLAFATLPDPQDASEAGQSRTAFALSEDRDGSSRTYGFLPGLMVAFRDAGSGP